MSISRCTSGTGLSENEGYHGIPKKTNGFFDENDDQSDKDMDF
jgi:hypothetical protein